MFKVTAKFDETRQTNRRRAFPHNKSCCGGASFAGETIDDADNYRFIGDSASSEIVGYGINFLHSKK